MACADTTAPDEVVPKDRPAEWATPIGDVPGLPNLHKVSDELYRGGQPEEDGFFELRKLKKWTSKAFGRRLALSTTSSERIFDSRITRAKAGTERRTALPSKP